MGRMCEKKRRGNCSVLICLIVEKIYSDFENNFRKEFGKKKE